jgi:hypothetical protein
MKVTLDLDKLLEEGSIDEAEYDKLSRLSAGGTTALAFNILIGFGVIAVGAGSLALLPTATTAIVLGLVVCAAGVALVFARYEQWTLLASICVLVGALLFGGGVIIADEGSVRSFLIVAAVFAAAGVLARSVLLTVLAVLALSSCIGTRTGYLHASYYLGVEEPSATVVLFTLFGIAMFQLSKRLSADYEKIAVAASRTGVFLVNFGFWIGSLWGDRIETIKLVVADWVFALLWAVALVATGVWGWKRNRRWVVNVIAVFAAIHFYTQWFERLGASPESVLIAGLLALGFAVGLRAVNVRLGKMA